PRRHRGVRSWWPSVTAVCGRSRQPLPPRFGGAPCSRTTAATSASGDACEAADRSGDDDSEADVLHTRTATRTCLSVGPAPSRYFRTFTCARRFHRPACPSRSPQRAEGPTHRRVFRAYRASIAELARAARPELNGPTFPTQSLIHGGRRRPSSGAGP